MLAAFTVIAFTVSVVLHGSTSSSIPPPSPSLFPLLIQCDECLPSLPHVAGGRGGVMVWFPGLASHGCSLHRGTGYQYWMLLDMSSTQFPLSNAVDGFNFF